MHSLRFAMLLPALAVLALSGCATPPAAAAPSRPPAPAASEAATPSPAATPDSTPTAAPTEAPLVTAPAPPPAAITVYLSGLPAGSHPIHLHSACDGRQGFHIQTLGALGGGGSAVDLPSGDFGRGWCLVVYTDGSLSRVLQYRPL